MILERGNVRLVRLTEDHIELVRHWRNFPAIRDTMEYREYITEEMQKKWFDSINNINNNYFLIETAGKFVGLIYGSGIDWEQGITGNGGIFIWDNAYLESVEILQAALLITDLGFIMGMKVNYIKILNDNARSIAFNLSMGYKLLPGQDGIYNQSYELRQDDYYNAIEKVRQRFGFSSNIQIYLSQAEYSTRVGLVEKLMSAKQRGENISLEIVA